MKGTFAGIGVLLIALGIGSIFTASRPGGNAGNDVIFGLISIAGGAVLLWSALSGGGSEKK